MPSLQPCGTPAAYRRHLRRGEQTCSACRAAQVASVAPYLAVLRPPRRLRPCGTATAYQRHIRHREVPCRACCAAHAAAHASWRGRVGRGRVEPENPALYHAARHGHEPAEALSTADRHLLVTRLSHLGWSDQDIAAHTRMTLYTTARIRTALGLLPNAGPVADLTKEAAA